MQQWIRERLTLILIGLLPFHALLVTVLTKLIAGPGHAPLPMLALWKEGLLGAILLIALLEIVLFWRRGSGVGGRGSVLRFDMIDGCICGLLFLALGLFFSSYPLPPTPSFLLGFKYDFVPLVAFLILRRVPWSEAFKKQAMRLILIIGGIIAGYGMLTFFLPQSFFTALGYSDLHSLYLPDAPLAAFQQIEVLEVRRIQSVMSGPNQLGLWLLIPWSICCTSMFAKKFEVRSSKFQKIINWAVPIVIAMAILLTFSRSAWVAAGVILFAVLWQNVPRRAFNIILMQSLFLGAVCITMVILVAPQLILRTASTRDHLERPLEAIQTIVAHPFGLGLGSAGPASNRVRDACVHLPAGSDASWAKDRPSLCVFVADKQTQPLDRACNCPRLPENWYLQIGVEMGVIGFVLYAALIILVLKRLVERGKRKEESESFSTFHFPLSTFLAFLGISIAALFLHAWEDAAVAYTAWMLLSATLSVRSRQAIRSPRIDHSQPPFN